MTWTPAGPCWHYLHEWQGSVPVGNALHPSPTPTNWRRMVPWHWRLCRLHTRSLGRSSRTENSTSTLVAAAPIGESMRHRRRTEATAVPVSRARAMARQGEGPTINGIAEGVWILKSRAADALVYRISLRQRVILAPVLVLSAVKKQRGRQQDPQSGRECGKILDWIGRICAAATVFC
jgi:hypothetical protein